jgi:hypothetical protein
MGYEAMLDYLAKKQLDFWIKTCWVRGWISDAEYVAWQKKLQTGCLR